MEHYKITLEPGLYFHIYNRGINGTNLFYREKDYYTFRNRYNKYLGKYVDTFAFCFLKNHFHILLKVKFIEPMPEKTFPSNYGLHHPEKFISKQLSDFFNSYSKTINIVQNRTGGLFETPFRRIIVDDIKYFKSLIRYIHFNPIKHGFVRNIEDYRYSSYNSMLTSFDNQKESTFIKNCFKSKEDFILFHQNYDVDLNIDDFF